MQRDTAELIEFWKKKFDIDLPNNKLNLYKIEQIVYYYKIQEIIKIVVKLKESDLFKIISYLNPRNNCISFDWDDKLESLYSWIVTYFHPQHMSWTDFTILIELGIKFDINLIIGTAQKLANSGKPLSLPYLRKVVESSIDENVARQIIEEQIISSRIVDISGDTTKEAINTSELTNIEDLLDEI